MLALFTTGGPEWIIILIVALLLFGRRLPEVMRSMGQGIRQFKKGLREVEEDIDATAEVDSDPEPKKLPDRESGSGASSLKRLLQGSGRQRNGPLRLASLWQQVNSEDGNQSEP